MPWGARQGGEAHPRWAVEDVGFEVGGSARRRAGLWAAELWCRLECNRMGLRPGGFGCCELGVGGLEIEEGEIMIRVRVS